MKKCPFSQGTYCTEDCMLYNAEKKICNMGNYEVKDIILEARVKKLEEEAIKNLHAAQEATTSSKKRSIK